VSGGGVFQYIQALNAFFAPPFAAIFVLGLLTRRVNASGAITAIIGGFALGIALKVAGSFLTLPRWFYPFANQAAMMWIASMLLCIGGSWLHRRTAPGGAAPAPAVTLWDSAALLRQGLGATWSRSVILWSAGFVFAILAVMLVFSDFVFPSAVSR
jgi:SSS family solute:Na+ symporter